MPSRCVTMDDSRMDRKVFAWLGLAFAALALSACIGTYVPPTAGPTATVRFTTPHVITNNPVMIHTDKCSELDALLVGRLHSKTFGDTYRDAIETTVPADRKLSVSMIAGENEPGFWTRTFLSCRRIVDFYPKAGARYEVVYSYSLPENKCSYHVWKLETDPQGKETRIEEPIEVRACRL
jgi:hypothetical protein